MLRFLVTESWMNDIDGDVKSKKLNKSGKEYNIFLLPITCWGYSTYVLEIIIGYTVSWYGVVSHSHLMFKLNADKRTIWDLINEKYRNAITRDYYIMKLVSTAVVGLKPWVTGKLNELLGTKEDVARPKGL